jgi:hypothetical protein
MSSCPGALTWSCELLQPLYYHYLTRVWDQVKRLLVSHLLQALATLPR